MPNERPVTYTERVSVALSAEQRDQLRHYARERGTAIAIVLREAALKAIGRADLSLADETQYTIGAMLDRKHSKPAGLGARAVVNLTRQQRKALDRAALVRGTTPSNILRTAGLRAARIDLPAPQPLGRPLGH